MSSLERPHRTYATIVALILSTALTALHAQTTDALFAERVDSSGLTAPSIADPRPFAVRSRTATLNFNVLDSALSSPATNAFTLNLFDDASFAVAVERIERSGFGHRTWVGHIVERPLSTVTLTQKDDFVTGLITDGTAAYEIVPVGDGVHRIDQMHTSLMPQERDVVLSLPAIEVGEPIAGAALSAPATGTTIDILVYYSTTLKNAIGQTAVESRIAQYVAETNTAYVRSNINGRLNLVGVAEINTAEPSDPGSLLNSFAANPAVGTQRNAVGADLVALLVGSFAGDTESVATCGVGYVGSGSGAAFSVTASREACLHTFAHETGHNLGAQHAPEDPVIFGAGLPEYARGHKVPGVFRTVMAYGCAFGSACPRILNYSNPAVLTSSVPTGVAGQRNNALRIAELFPSVAAYSGGAPPPQAPSASPNLQAIINGLNMTLQWQPPTLGTPTNYIVAAGTGPGLNNIAVASLGLTTSISAQLSAGAYFVRVFAQSAAGTSPASNEVSFTLSATSPPGPPRSLTFNVSGATVGFQWLAPSTGGPPSGYLLDAGTAPGTANLVAGAALPVNTSLVVPGVPAGRYFLRLRARNAGGVSGPSNEVDVTVGPPCTLPSAPQNFTFTRVQFTVGLSWSAPAVGVPSSYILQAGGSSGAANLFNSSVGLSTGLSAQVPAGTYFVRVRAANACGTGPASGEATIVVP